MIRCEGYPVTLLVPRQSEKRPDEPIQREGNGLSPYFGETHTINISRISRLKFSAKMHNPTGKYLQPLTKGQA